MRRLRARISAVDAVARFGGKYNVDVYLGDARFTGPRTLEVGGRQLEFDRAVIATGGRPAEVAIPGLKDAGFLTSETVFTLTRLPRRLAVIGGGPIGCELAQAFARLGSQVSQVEMAPRLMLREDEEVSALVQQSLEADGVQVLTGHKALRCELHDRRKVLIEIGRAHV